MKHLTCRLRPDIFALLFEAGYSTYRLRQEKLLSESTIQNIRNGDDVSLRTITLISYLIGTRDVLVWKWEDEDEIA